MKKVILSIKEQLLFNKRYEDVSILIKEKQSLGYHVNDSLIDIVATWLADREAEYTYDDCYRVSLSLIDTII